MKVKILLATVFSTLVAGCNTAPAGPASQMKMSGQAGEGMMGQMMMDMRQADVNGDGALSKEEFLHAHAAMFDRMKNENGVIRLGEMPGHCAAMMKGAKGQMGGGMMGGRMMGGRMMGGRMMGGGMDGDTMRDKPASSY